MTALNTPKIHRKKRIPRNVPEELVYEVIDGKPYYYNGYRDVLNNLKTIEEIMGCSSYQWMIIEYLLELLFKMPSRSKYRVATNEPGLHIDRRNNLSGDILVFKKEDLPASAISVKYADVPAYLHIEVDVTANLENEDPINYLSKKINTLLEFGTGRIIWVFTESRRVLEVTHPSEWKWHSWDTTVGLMDGAVFNIGEYLKKEGIEVSEA